MGNKRTVMFSPDTDPTVTERTMHLREQPLSPAAVLVLHKEVRPVNHNCRSLVHAHKPMVGYSYPPLRFLVYLVPALKCIIKTEWQNVAVLIFTWPMFFCEGL